MRKPGSSILIQFVIILALLAIPSIALADSIIFKSDLVNESNSNTGSNVPISSLYPTTGGDPNTGWQENGSNYFWVSYADTGYPSVNTSWPDNVVNLSDDPTAIFYETFSLPYNFNTGAISIWADDTARVYLDKLNDGVAPWMLWDAYPTQGAYCTAGAIGCIPSAGMTLDLTGLNLLAGDYQLQFDVYQRAGGPFGVLYTGSIDSQPIPEPSTLLLLASGALALCFFVRRRN
jgi:hypothetical protein